MAKRRTLKRRIDPKAQAEAWAMMFKSGYDFLQDAADFTGLKEPRHVYPPDDREEASRAWNAAARAAWRRVGHLHLAEHGAEDCWALEQFGAPESCR